MVKSEEKREEVHFHGPIGTVGAIGGSGHTITFSSAAGPVERQAEHNPPGISYNLTIHTLVEIVSFCFLSLEFQKNLRLL